MFNMEETQILNKTAEFVLDVPIEVEVKVLPKNLLEKVLIKLKLRSLKRKFYIRPATMGTMMRISRVLLSINQNIIDLSNINESNFKAIDQHIEKLAQVLALAVTNTKKEPDTSLIDLFLHNCSSAELKAITAIIVKQMNLIDFMTTIISILPMTILKNQDQMSPMNQGS